MSDDHDLKFRSIRGLGLRYFAAKDVRLDLSGGEGRHRRDVFLTTVITFCLIFVGLMD